MSSCQGLKFTDRPEKLPDSEITPLQNKKKQEFFCPRLKGV